MVRVNPNKSELIRINQSWSDRLSRLDFIVLSILCNNGANNKFNSMSVSEIKDAESLEYESNTFYKILKRFVELDAVAIGAKDGRANTYYITKKGEEMIKEAMG